MSTHELGSRSEFSLAIEGAQSELHACWVSQLKVLFGLRVVHVFPVLLCEVE